VDFAQVRASIDWELAGAEMHQRLRELYPICRSITGPGLRETLKHVGAELPLHFTEVPTGTAVLDWEIPLEWSIRDAYIADLDGKRVVDFRLCNLHVVGYSAPVDRIVSRKELDDHLHSLPEQPEVVPFRTAFYNVTWGFCLSEATRNQLTDEAYRVVIDSSLDQGNLTYAEHTYAGETDDEILLTTHVCHPSLANDNLSGIVVLTMLGALLQRTSPRYSYRLLFNPVTIGSIAWLAQHVDHLPRVAHGLVVSGVGDPGGLTYKRSRRGSATIDRAVEHVFTRREAPSSIEEFSPYGYDERQFCSPGFDLPVGCLSRTPHGRYAEYHTSADTPEFVQAAQLADSLSALLEVLEILEGDGRFNNTMPYGEPQLGRRGLYKAMGGHADASGMQMAILWTLNLSDGHHTLLDIANRADLPFALVRQAADALLDADLLRDADHARP
jgi:aminopeptidase-like protein